MDNTMPAQSAGIVLIVGRRLQFKNPVIHPVAVIGGEWIALFDHCTVKELGKLAAACVY